MNNSAAPPPPAKKLTTVRIDADVLEWLRSKGRGHLTRINQIVRSEMEADQRRASRKGKKLESKK